MIARILMGINFVANLLTHRIHVYRSLVDNAMRFSKTSVLSYTSISNLWDLSMYKTGCSTSSPIICVINTINLTTMFEHMPSLMISYYWGTSTFPFSMWKRGLFKIANLYNTLFLCLITLVSGRFYFKSKQKIRENITALEEDTKKKRIPWNLFMVQLCWIMCQGHIG